MMVATCLVLERLDLHLIPPHPFGFTTWLNQLSTTGVKHMLHNIRIRRYASMVCISVDPVHCCMHVASSFVSVCGHNHVGHVSEFSTRLHKPCRSGSLDLYVDYHRGTSFSCDGFCTVVENILLYGPLKNKKKLWRPTQSYRVGYR